MTLKTNLRTCPKGHKYYKSSDPTHVGTGSDYGFICILFNDYRSEETTKAL